MGSKHFILLILIVSVFELTRAQNVSVGVAVDTTPISSTVTATSRAPAVQEVINRTVESYFTANQIVPDIIPKAPTTRAYVTFPSGVQASLGNELTPTQVKNAPEVTWDAAPDLFYTLIVIDPDLPSHAFPAYRSTLHWCVVNIPGGNVSSGTTTAAYIGAGPPANTGKHRFIFLIYQQPGIVVFEEPKIAKTSTVGRHAFSPEQFALKYNLTGPVAGNFIQTSYDNYVTVLYESLGLSHANAVTPQYLTALLLAVLLRFNV